MLWSAAQISEDSALIVDENVPWRVKTQHTTTIIDFIWCFTLSLYKHCSIFSLVEQIIDQQTVLLNARISWCKGGVVSVFTLAACFTSRSLHLCSFLESVISSTTPTSHWAPSFIFSLSSLQATHPPTTTHTYLWFPGSPLLSSTLPHTILSSLSSQCLSCLSLLFHSFCRTFECLCISCCSANLPTAYTSLNPFQGGVEEKEMDGGKDEADEERWIHTAGSQL